MAGGAPAHRTWGTGSGWAQPGHGRRPPRACPAATCGAPPLPARELPQAGVPGGRTLGPGKVLNYSWERLLQRWTWQLQTFPSHPLSASTTHTHTHAPLDLPTLRAVLAAYSEAEHRSGMRRRGPQLRSPRGAVQILGSSKDSAHCPVGPGPASVRAAGTNRVSFCALPGSPPLLTRAARGFRPPAAARCPIPRTLRRPQSVQCGAPPARAGAGECGEGARERREGGGRERTRREGRGPARGARATPTRAGHSPPPAAAAGQPGLAGRGPISARGGSRALRRARSLARRARPNSGRVGLSAKSANSGPLERTAWP